MNITYIPLKNINADDEFNCRKNLTTISCLDLAKSIEIQGLLQPIVVQPTNEPGKFSLVCGFRRYKAVSALGWEAVPCNVIQKMDAINSHVANLVENLNRSELSLAEEAEAVKNLMRFGFNDKTIANRLSKSISWVVIRRQFVLLPREIQEEVTAGRLKQSDILKLAKIKDSRLQFEAVRLIKEAKSKKIKQEKLTLNTEIKKARGRAQIILLQDKIRQLFGNSYATIALAWAAGEINTHELCDGLREACEEEGVPYTLDNNDVRDLI